MRLALINPNSTATMTEKIVAAARAVACPDVEIAGHTCLGSPPAIEGPEDGCAAVPHVLAAVRAAERDGAAACIIACFDDTALVEARAAVRIPVIGIGEAAFHAAMMLGHRFSVVTTLSISVPVIVANLHAYGLNSACLAVRASEVPVLELERPGSSARDKVSAEIGRALAELPDQAIVLGCAGMADLAAEMAARHGVAVIDGVAAATGMATALARLVPAAVA